MSVSAYSETGQTSELVVKDARFFSGFRPLMSDQEALVSVVAGRTELEIILLTSESKIQEIICKKHGVGLGQMTKLLFDM